MQKIWDTQRQRTLYAIDEAALYRRVSAKAAAADRWININEIGLTIISVFTGGFLIVDAFLDQKGSWDFAGGILFFLIAGWLLIRRRNRLRATPDYARSLLGQLDFALESTRQLIRMNVAFQYFFLLPVAVFSIGGVLWQSSPLGSTALMIGGSILAWILVRWELRAKFLPRRRELEKLRDTLTREAATGDGSD